MDHFVEVTDSTFDDEVIEQDKFLKLVYFYFPWLSHCREDLETLSGFIKEYKKRVQFFKINVDKNPKISSRYSIRNEPTIIIFNRGEENKRISGEINESEIKIELDALVEDIKKIKKEFRDNDFQKGIKKRGKKYEKKNNNCCQLENESQLRRRNKTGNRNKR